jgi:hypothetical protein
VTNGLHQEPNGVKTSIREFCPFFLLARRKDMKKIKCQGLNRCLCATLAAFVCAGAIAVFSNGMTVQKVAAEVYDQPKTLATFTQEEVLPIEYDADDAESADTAESADDAEGTLDGDAQDPTADTQQGEVANGKSRTADPVTQSSQSGIPVWVAILCGVGVMCAAMVVAGICISINNRVKWHK